MTSFLITAVVPLTHRSLVKIQFCQRGSAEDGKNGSESTPKGKYKLVTFSLVTCKLVKFVESASAFPFQRKGQDSKFLTNFENPEGTELSRQSSGGFLIRTFFSGTCGHRN